jgi:tRNA1(Val) A37 N6-methylase TrmN6
MEDQMTMVFSGVMDEDMSILHADEAMTVGSDMLFLESLVAIMISMY